MKIRKFILTIIFLLSLADTGSALGEGPSVVKGEGLACTNQNVYEISYSQNGVKIASGNFFLSPCHFSFNGNLPDGIILITCRKPSGDIIQMEQPIINSVTSGNVKIYRNYQLITNIKFTNNFANGLCKKYEKYQGEPVEEICYYVNGKKNGPFLAYTKNGRIFVRGFYTNDQEDGLWEQYWKNTDKINYKQYFQQGQVVRLIKQDPNGNILGDLNYD